MTIQAISLMRVCILRSVSGSMEAVASSRRDKEERQGLSDQEDDKDVILGNLEPDMAENLSQ